MIRFFQGIKEIKNFREDYEDFKNKITAALEVHGIHLESAELSDREKKAALAFGMSYERYRELLDKQKPTINPTLSRVIDLEFDIYELKETIKTLQSKLDKEQVPAQLILAEQAKTVRKPKALKLQKVEEEVKKVKSKLTQAKVKRLFEYRDGELYWKKSVGSVKKGEEAGSMSGKGYKQVGIDKNVYRYGRIIYLMFHGYLPECVSYIDSNCLNTRIENLREATPSQISCHKKKLSNNTSAFKGVSFHKQVGKYKAAIVKKKKSHHLGYFDTPQEAYRAYCKAAKKLHGEFARVA